MDSRSATLERIMQNIAQKGTHMYYPWAAWWWWFAWVIPILLMFWAFSGWGSRRWDNGYGYGYGSNRNSRRSSNGDWRVNGNRPKYRNRGPLNYHRSDDRIFDDVCTLLMASEELDPSAVEVRVLNGEVTLLGTVESRFEKQLAERLADSPPGVTDVNNQLRIGPVDHSTPARPYSAPEPHPTAPNA